MPIPRSLRSLGHQRSSWLVLLGAGGAATAIALASPSLGLPSSSSSAISDSPKEVIDQVWQIVYRDYLDSTGQYNPEDWKVLRKDLLSKNYSATSESYEAIRGMLASLDDPYTRFLDPKEFKEMQIDTSGELTGVGIQLSLDKDTKELVVVSPIEGTPASKAGVQPKDVIVFINGQSTKGMSTADAVKLIRGKEGSEVTLGLRRRGEVIQVPLIRARIEIQAVDIQLNTTVDGTKIAMGSDAQGDILYHGASDYTRLAKGTAGQSLVMNSGATAPEWGIGGKLLQLAHTTAAFTSTAISTTNNTWTDTDVLITFTPVSTASKFIVSFGIGSAVNADADDGGYGYRIKKVQNSTTSYPSRLTDYTGSANIHSRRYFYSSNVSSVNNWFEYDTFQGVDADAHTTASLTYTIQCAQLNLDNNLTIGNVGNAVPQMMVMEIAN